MIYLEDWETSKQQGMLEDFNITEEWLVGFTVLLAYYLYENYSGGAFVLLQSNEGLFEVNGSHCSCHGLEGQWELEDTTVEALRYRVTKGNVPYSKELLEVLESLEVAK
jgi:hypothetical protein